MIKFHILTLFPEFIESFFATSIIKRGFEKGSFDFSIKNIRDNAINKHGQVDDAPFGGGAGMLMRPEPLFEAFESLSIPDAGRKVLFFSPKGRKIDYQYIIDLTKYENIVLICGHYEGIDQRVIDTLVDEEVSLGDFVLTGGEIPAMALIDGVARQIDGVLKPHSLDDESFTDGLLECRQYTRPACYKGLSVPAVLLSGNHKEICKYRINDSVRETLIHRPDLIDKYSYDENIRMIISKLKRELGDVNNCNN